MANPSAKVDPGGRIVEVNGQRQPEAMLGEMGSAPILTMKCRQKAKVRGAASAGGGPTSERFEALHPRCGETCKAFDPQRRSAHGVKKGMCGTNITCGFGR